MKNCSQTETQTIFEHGESVHWYYQDIYNHLTFSHPLHYAWRLPSWIYDDKIKTAIQAADPEIIKNYHIFHDCGKPFCRTIDEQGRQHFPDHASVSYHKWLMAGGDPTTGHLILHDMDAHSKDIPIENFIRNPKAIILLITALAEIHSNASMFGGIESVSFKIKWKRLDKIGKRITQNDTRTLGVHGNESRSRIPHAIGA